MIDLRTRQQKVAEYLQSRGGKWVSTDAIHRDVFGRETCMQNVRVCIYTLRQKGLPIESDCLGSSSRGYRWAGVVA